MCRTIVGISANLCPVDEDGKNIHTSVSRKFVDGVRMAGGLPMVIPLGDKSLVEDYVETIDKLILSGGQNVHPKFYGEEKTIDSDDYNIARDEFELALLKEALRQNKPVMAICRGLQLVNVAFGGTLNQQIDNHWQPVDALLEGNDFTADMVISIGGDGTFLKAARRVGRKQIPILGINTGRLGFLADVSPEEMEVTFEEIQAGRYSVEERSVLQLICNDRNLQESPYALNEIAVLKRDSSSMISIRTAINGAYLNTYQADGLVIATPTGSTAYSLSVGGPIIVPHSNTIAITPVAPHSLNVRPIVIRDDWEITLDVESRSHNFLVAIDGSSETCKETTQLTIHRADYSIKVVKRFNHIFFDTLRSKMMWGADGRR